VWKGRRRGRRADGSPRRFFPAKRKTAILGSGDRPPESVTAGGPARAGGFEKALPRVRFKIDAQFLVFGEDGHIGIREASGLGKPDPITFSPLSFRDRGPGKG